MEKTTILDPIFNWFYAHCPTWKWHLNLQALDIQNTVLWKTKSLSCAWYRNKYINQVSKDPCSCQTNSMSKIFCWHAFWGKFFTTVRAMCSCHNLIERYIIYIKMKTYMLSRLHWTSLALGQSIGCSDMHCSTSFHNLSKGKTLRDSRGCRSPLYMQYKIATGRMWENGGLSVNICIWR